MNNFKASSIVTEKNTINNGNSSSAYIPQRIVMSSFISRKDLCKNAEETNEFQETVKLDEIDGFFQNLNQQVQDNIKVDKDQLKLKSLSIKNKDFASEFLQYKKRFEAESADNTRIYGNSSKSGVNREKMRDQNNEEYKVEMNCADKYVAKLNRNWVPGKMMTKVRINSPSDSSNFVGSTRNKTLLNERSVMKDQDLKIRQGEWMKSFYAFPHHIASAEKKSKSKKRPFIEEFCEFRDRIGVMAKKKTNRDEDIKRDIEEGEASSSNPPIRQLESDPLNNNRIITPFSVFKTSFFSKSLVEFEERSNMKRDNDKRRDITVDWIKGDVIKRQGENITHNFIASENQEQNSNKMYKLGDRFSPKNYYNKISLSYTPAAAADNKISRDLTKNEYYFKNQCTSAVTMSNTSMQYSKTTDMYGPKVVITQTKVTELTSFPPHLLH